MQKQQASHSQPSQTQTHNAPQLNRTVEGVAAAFYGLLLHTHRVELSSSLSFDSQFNVFNNNELVRDPKAPTIEDHINKEAHK